MDGDAFFVACEVSLHPEYRGLPVVTGAERSIITALSYEAKALGLTRTMPVYQVKKQFPHVIIIESNYSNYQIFSQRMFAIVRRYTDLVEEYSIDECFADFSTVKDPERIAQEIQKNIVAELGITVSIGLGPTKVLAKIASKQNKPKGFTSFLKERNIGEIPIRKVWGIGQSATAQLTGLGVITITDFIKKDRSLFSKPHQQIWYELQGISVLPVEIEHDPQQSIAHTRSFLFSTKNKEIIWGELVKNIEAVCVKARKAGFDATAAHVFIKTKEFQYSSVTIPFQTPLSDPISITKLVSEKFNELFKKNILYRATGITLQQLVPRNSVQSLFATGSHSGLFDIIDTIAHKYGEGIVQVASSKKIELDKRPFAILSLGVVS